MRKLHFVDGEWMVSILLIDNENNHIDSYGHSMTYLYRIKLKGKILKGLNPFNMQNIISNLYHIGIPEKVSFNPQNIINIDVSDISFLDFDLDENEINYLIESGYKSVKNFFKKDKRGGINYWYFNGMLILALLIIKKFL